MECRQHAPVSQSGGGGPQQSNLLVPGAVNRQGADTQVEEEGRCGTRRRPPQPSQADNEAGQAGRIFHAGRRHSQCVAPGPYAGVKLAERESRSRHEVCCPSPEARRHRKSCAHADGCAAERRVAPTQMVARPREEDPAGSEVLAPVERGASEVSTARLARPPAGKGCSSVREGGAGSSESEDEIYVTGKKKAHS